MIASGIPAADWASHFDTISICFSKGLGAPRRFRAVGTKDHLTEMCDAVSYSAAACGSRGSSRGSAVRALENNIERLADDHQSAKIVAQHIKNTEGLKIHPETVHTNIVIFQVDSRLGTAAQFCANAQANGAWMLPFSHEHVRAVTHLHITHDDAESAGKIISQTAEQMSTVASSQS